MEFPQPFQHKPDMSMMFGRIPGIHEHVVDVDDKTM